MLPVQHDADLRAFPQQATNRELIKLGSKLSHFTFVCVRASGLETEAARKATRAGI